jgi:hypothetical protein
MDVIIVASKVGCDPDAEYAGAGCGQSSFGTQMPKKLSSVSTTPVSVLTRVAISLLLLDWQPPPGCWWLADRLRRGSSPSAVLFLRSIYEEGDPGRWGHTHR